MERQFTPVQYQGLPTRDALRANYQVNCCGKLSLAPCETCDFGTINTRACTTSSPRAKRVHADPLKPLHLRTIGLRAKSTKTARTIVRGSNHLNSRRHCAYCSPPNDSRGTNRY